MLEALESFKVSPDLWTEVHAGSFQCEDFQGGEIRLSLEDEPYWYCHLTGGPALFTQLYGED